MRAHVIRRLLLIIPTLFVNVRSTGGEEDSEERRVGGGSRA